MEKEYSYETFLEIVERLRGENGCPWDRAQTHASLKAGLIEECYELIEAIDRDDATLMQEELGDVLLQVVMHAQIAKEEGKFTMQEVVQGIANKMVYRHPHVFKEGARLDDLINPNEVKTVQDVKDNWEKIKENEKHEEHLVQSMDRVAKTLPALMRTQKVQKKAMKFEENQITSAQQIDTLIKALENIKTRDFNGQKEELEQEMGKIVFDLVNLSTFFDINAEFALTKSLEEFINRFRYIENSRFRRV